MLYLQEAPLETTGYMIAGFVVIFGVMLLYLVSLLVRSRNLQQDLELLAELEGSQQPSPGRQPEAPEGEGVAQ